MSLGLPEYIEQRISPEPNSGCWLWAGGMNARGYGMLWIRNKGAKKARGIFAHRLVYTLLKAPIWYGTEIDHLCRNKCCCNPDHLEAVTHRVNVQRGNAGYYERKLVTHCHRGHPYTEENTYRSGKQRACAACHKIHRRKYYLTKGK